MNTNLVAGRSLAAILAAASSLSPGLTRNPADTPVAIANVDCGAKGDTKAVN